MSRVKGICMGDCGSCELLAREEVDMVPCVLDQIFRRVQKQEAEISELKQQISGLGKMPFSGVENPEPEVITQEL